MTMERVLDGRGISAPAVPGAPAPGRAASPRRGWEVVDDGWGRRAVDFATLSEPGNCREYVAMHHRLGVSEGDRLMDVACGAGLAIELASMRGAECAGIDASPRLVAVARDRNPDADIRVGDMHALPWDDASIEAATDQARKLVRDGLPLRAPIAAVGYLARKPRPRRTASP